MLIHEAVGDQLTCVFVDHGLMRQGEAEEVVRLFRGHFNIPLVHVDAAEEFLGALEGLDDPEAKRKTIGKLFVETFEAEARRIATDGRGKVEFLAQGTLYPDVIESVSFTGGPSVTIKSHHNVGGLPERMQMKLVEPLRELFKDEVRKLGRELGLPEHFVGRHPFPGPGLAIRVPGAVTREKLEILRKADAIYLDEIRKAGLYDTIWQAFAVLLPVRTVGVMGDGRTYDYVVALRAVTSVDGMTADFYPFDMSFLARAATRIINEVKGREPGGLRRDEQAAGDDRVGVGGNRTPGFRPELRQTTGWFRVSEKSEITLLAGSVQRTCRTRRSDTPPWVPSECNPVWDPASCAASARPYRRRCCRHRLVARCAR